MTIGIIKYVIEFAVSIYHASTQEKVDSTKLTGEILAGKWTKFSIKIKFFWSEKFECETCFNALNFDIFVQ